MYNKIKLVGLLISTTCFGVGETARATYHEVVNERGFAEVVLNTGATNVSIKMLGMTRNEFNDKFDLLGAINEDKLMKLFAEDRIRCLTCYTIWDGGRKYLIITGDWGLPRSGFWTDHVNEQYRRDEFTNSITIISFNVNVKLVSKDKYMKYTHVKWAEICDIIFPPEIKTVTFS